MNEDQYVQLVRDLVSSDPERVRIANRELYKTCVDEYDSVDLPHYHADLALVAASKT